MLRPVSRPLAYLLILVVFGSLLPPAPAQAILPSAVSQLPSDALAKPKADVSSAPAAQIVRGSQPAATPYGPRVSGAAVPPASTLARQPDIDQLPLAFFANKGQTDARVRFQAQSPAGSLFFTLDEVVLGLPSDGAKHKRKDEAPKGKEKGKPATAGSKPTILRVQFLGTNGAAEILGTDMQPGVVNFLNGSDRKAWKNNLPTYAGLTYRELYPGIDLRYAGSDGRIKGTYTVATGMDPASIRWRYQGATNVQIDAATGDLLITLPTGAAQTHDPAIPAMLREHAPIAWQDIDGQRVPVSVRYNLAGNGSIGFTVGTYDPAHPLTIDPTIDYGSFLGAASNGTDFGQSITVDGSGNMYISGYTDSGDFPTTSGAYDTSINGDYDIFLTKLNSSGGLVLQRGFCYHGPSTT